MFFGPFAFHGYFPPLMEKYFHFLCPLCAKTNREPVKETPHVVGLKMLKDFRKISPKTRSRRRQVSAESICDCFW